MRIGKLRRTALEISGLLFAIGLIAAGCAATAPAPTPIRDPTQRLDLPGLSVLPPKGANWFLTSVPPKPDVPVVLLVTFAKKLREEQPTRPADARVIYARVTAADLQDPRMQAPAAFETLAAFLDWLKQSAEKRTGEMVTGRQRLIEHDATLDDSLGATCARYRRVTELTGLGSFRESVFILATRGLFCLHPHWPRYLIDVGYTQLHLKGENPLPLDAEVEPFLKSPAFTTTRPVAAVPTPGRWDAQMKAGRKAFDEQRWSDAEAAFKAALAEAERAFEPQDRRLAHTLYSLAIVYHKQDRRAEAEPLYRRALAIYEQHPGADQRRYGQTLHDLGYLYLQQGQHEQAEALLRRSLAVREVALGPDDLDVGQSLYNVMDLYNVQHRWAEAEPFARRALAIYERAKGPNDARVARIPHVLGHLLEAQGRLAEAEPFLRRGIAMAEKVLGPDHPEVAHRLEGYAVVLRKLGRQPEAEELEARARAIRAKAPKSP